MQLHHFTDPANFLCLTQPYLEKNESANNLILGVTIRLDEHPEWVDQFPFMATLTAETGQLALAAVMTPPNHLLLSSLPDIKPSVLDDAIDMLVNHLGNDDWIVPGVNAENSLAERFAKRWSENTGQAHTLLLRERVYELRQVIPPKNPPAGALRPAVPADLETVAGWHYAFSMEAIHEGDLEVSRKVVARRLANGDVYLWQDQKPVSMAFRSRPTTHGVTVSAVYTPPELRGRGYASACVAALSQRLLDSGKQFCNLFTDLDYPTSNAIYQKIGYKPVCDFFDFQFE